MVVFNAETTPSRSFGRRDLASMIVEVAAREPWGENAVGVLKPNGDERQSCREAYLTKRVVTEARRRAIGCRILCLLPGRLSFETLEKCLVVDR